MRSFVGIVFVLCLLCLPTMVLASTQPSKVQRLEARIATWRSMQQDLSKRIDDLRLQQLGLQYQIDKVQEQVDAMKKGTKKKVAPPEE